MEGLVPFHMARRVGRPKKPDEEKKRVVSVSMDRVDIVILDAMCDHLDVTRSQMMRKLIQDAGLQDHGIVGSEKHAGYQNYTLKKTGLKACNPYLSSGRCQHSACQHAYRQEGL